MTRFGVDLSDFDRGRGPVDVAAMARDGITVLTHKATEGTSVKHKYLGATLNAAKAAGIPYLGAYMVPRTPGNGGAGSIAAQVAYYLAYLDAQVPWWRTFPRWFHQVDTEMWYSGGVCYDAVDPRYGVEACTRLAATGKPLVHYAPKWAYGDGIGGGEPLWASQYGSNPAGGYRQAYAAAGGDNGPGWVRYSGRTPLVWQFGSKCTVGSQPGCDADAIRDDAAWVRLIEGDDMSGYAASQPDWADDDVWRSDAIAGSSEVIRGGRWKGQPVQLAKDIHALIAGQGRILAALAPLADLRAALVAALTDPTVLAKLAATQDPGAVREILTAALDAAAAAIRPAA